MNIRLKKMLVAAMLTAIAFILQIFEFPIPALIPGFIKFDFSDLPALVASYAIGTPYGILVCLLKNVLHLIDSSSGGVGELSNFILGASLCLVSGLMKNISRTRVWEFFSMLSGALAMGILSFPINRYIVYPVYYRIFAPQDTVLEAYRAIMPGLKDMDQALLIFNVPFTAAKGIACAIITFLLYKYIKRAVRL